MKEVIIVFLALYSSSIQANELFLYAGGYSHHFEEPKENQYVDEHNEVNEVLALEYHGAIFGRFVNSYGHVNTFAAYVHEFDHFLIGSMLASNYKGRTCPTAHIKNFCLIPIISVKLPKSPVVVGLLPKGLSITFRHNLTID